MSAFPDWQSVAVPQRHTTTGCIPWSFEIIIRAAGVPGIDYSTFQEDFDLDRNRPAGSLPQNNFGSVAQAVSAKYASVRFTQRSFAAGADKLAFVEERIQKHQPTVVSIALEGLTNGASRDWHIMPVVDSDADHLVLLHAVTTSGQATVLRLPKAEFVRIHDNFQGGHEVAFLDP